MARTVDDRVVAMSFENDKFESGINTSIHSLGKLKDALNFSGASKGLDGINTSANRVDLSHIASAVDSIKSRFSGLGLVATAAIGGIAAKAGLAGLSLVKSLTVQPLVDGFHNYETQINAVQTILANTGLSGSKGLAQVTGVLKDLNKYANQTVYNFSQMTQNIGTFTAAGVDLKTSAESIKGIANLAALSGSNSEQASTAMYQLSQAIAAGRVKLQDWNSVVNAGLGGKVFQTALFNTGQAMGTIKNAKLGETFAQWTAAGNTFRGSLQSGWVTSKVLTTTLKDFTGDMTTAQLKAQGFTDSQAAAIIKMGAVAKGAATNIKTASQLSQALKEEVATAWGAIFSTLFGNINQATSIFSKAHTFLENALTGPIYKLNTLLEAWAKLGGRSVAIDAIKNAVKDLGEIIAPIKEAWKDVFPATTAQTLFSITQHVDELVKKLKPSPQTVDELRRTFAGLFAILDIGKTIIGDVFHVFAALFGVVGGTGGGIFLHLTAHLGDFLVKVDEMVKKGNVLTAFFAGLSHILADPAKLFDDIRKAVEKLFGNFDSGGVSNALHGLNGQLTPLGKLVEMVKGAWDKLTQSMQGASSTLHPLIQGIDHLFQSIVTFLTNGLQNLNFDQVLHGIDVGLLGGIFLMFKRFFSGAKLTDLVGGGVLGSVRETFEGLTGSLGAMQQKVKADALRQIAIAVGILAASMLALSFIPPKRLDSALGGLTLAMGELVGAMAILNKIGSGTLGALRLGAIAAGLILLAAAVDLLVLAVIGLSRLSWSELTRGLAGVAAILFTISKTVEPIAANSAGMISAGLGIIAIAAGIKILASAVKDFGDLSLEQLAKGLGAVGVALVGIGLSAKLFPTGMIEIGAGLVGIAFAMKILAGAIGQLGGEGFTKTAGGIAALAGSLSIIALAMRSMPPNLIVQAAGLVVVSVALKGIASAIESFRGTSSDTVAKGLLGIGLALGILAIALSAMTSALPGAAALLVASTALTLLAPAMRIIGDMSVGDIAKALVALAGAFTILGIAGLLIGPVAPALLALGGALLAIGAGLALAGAGVALVGVGLGAIAAAAPVAIAVIIHSIVEFVTAIPKFISGIVNAIVSMVDALAKAAPQFVVAIGKILTSLAEAVITAMPHIVTAFGALVQGALKAIRDNLPSLVQTGLDMVVSLLTGIKSHIGAISTQAIGVITTFLDSLAKHLPDVVASGTKVVLSFLDGVARNVGKVVKSAINIVANFINGVADNIWKVIGAGANLLIKFVSGIASGDKKLITAGINLVINFLAGIASLTGRVIRGAVQIIGSFITSIGKASLQLVDKGAEAIINFMNGVARAIRRYEPQIFQAGYNIASAIIDGLVQGIGDLAHKVIHGIEHLITSLPDKALSLLGISSPSRVFMEIGGNIAEGLALGISNNSNAPVAAVKDMTDKMTNTMRAVPEMLTNIMEFKSPVIKPVLDLSLIKESAAKIPGFMPDVPIKSFAVLGNPDAPTALDNTPPTDQGGSALGPVRDVSFTQINNSPEPLSPVEIYRQTRNQISQLKPILGAA